MCVCVGIYVWVPADAEVTDCFSLGITSLQRERYNLFCASYIALAAFLNLTLFFCMCLYRNKVKPRYDSSVDFTTRIICFIYTRAQYAG